MTEFPHPPQGWTVAERWSAGPFTTGVTYAHPDGSRVEWSSRAHRKHASRLSRCRPGVERILWAPHRASWWIALLFAISALGFLAGALLLLPEGARTQEPT